MHYDQVDLEVEYDGDTETLVVNRVDFQGETGVHMIRGIREQITVNTDDSEHNWDEAEHIVTDALTSDRDVVPLGDLLPHIPEKRVKGFVTATTDDGEPAIPAEDAAAIVEHGQSYDATE